MESQLLFIRLRLQVCKNNHNISFRIKEAHHDNYVMLINLAVEKDKNRLRLMETDNI